MARYLPKDGKPVSLANLVEEVRAKEAIVINENHWALSPTNWVSQEFFASPVFYNKNAVGGRVLVVMSDRSITWVATPLDRRVGNGADPLND